jgi:hypothetical protein
MMKDWKHTVKPLISGFSSFEAEIVIEGVESPFMPLDNLPSHLIEAGYET